MNVWLKVLLSVIALNGGYILFVGFFYWIIVLSMASYYYLKNKNKKKTFKKEVAEVIKDSGKSIDIFAWGWPLTIPFLISNLVVILTEIIENKISHLFFGKSLED